MLGWTSSNGRTSASASCACACARYLQNTHRPDSCAQPLWAAYADATRGPSTATGPRGSHRCGCTPPTKSASRQYAAAANPRSMRQRKAAKTHMERNCNVIALACHCMYGRRRVKHAARVFWQADGQKRQRRLRVERLCPKQGQNGRHHPAPMGEPSPPACNQSPFFSATPVARILHPSKRGGAKKPSQTASRRTHPRVPLCKCCRQGVASHPYTLPPGLTQRVCVCRKPTACRQAPSRGHVKPLVTWRGAHTSNG